MEEEFLGSIRRETRVHCGERMGVDINLKLIHGGKAIKNLYLIPLVDFETSGENAINIYAIKDKDAEEN